MEINRGLYAGYGFLRVVYRVDRWFYSGGCSIACRSSGVLMFLVTIQGWAHVVVPDLSCTTVGNSFALASNGSIGLTPICPNDPVIAGTIIQVPNWGYFQVTAINNSDGTTYVPGSSTAAAAAPAATSSQAISVTVKDAFGTATADQYAAMSLLFGAALGVMSAIWGVKKLLAVLRHAEE